MIIGKTVGNADSIARALSTGPNLQYVPPDRDGHQVALAALAPPTHPALSDSDQAALRDLARQTVAMYAQRSGELPSSTIMVQSPAAVAFLQAELPKDLLQYVRILVFGESA